MFFTCDFSYFQKVSLLRIHCASIIRLRYLYSMKKRSQKKLVLFERFFSHKKLRIDFSISAFVIIHLVSQWYLYNIILRPNRVFLYRSVICSGSRKLRRHSNFFYRDCIFTTGSSIIELQYI